MMAELVEAAVRAATGRGVRRTQLVGRSGGHVVVYAEPAGSDHAVVVRFPADASSAARQTRVRDVVPDRVPLAEAVFADANGSVVGCPVLVDRWVDGERLDVVLDRVTGDDARRLGEVVGDVVAAMATRSFPVAGWFSDDLTIEPRERTLADGVLRHVRQRLYGTEGGRALSAAARGRFWGVVADHARELVAVADCAALVHGDLAPRNVLVRRCGGVWRVAAVLDWEFALSGSSLLDLGHLLRDRPQWSPDFGEGVAAGARLGGVNMPVGWRRLAWLLDAVSLTGPLARAAGDPGRVMVSAVIERGVHPWDSP